MTVATPPQRQYNSVKIASNGFLQCLAAHEENATYWCGHIEHLIKEGQDAGLFWPENAEPAKGELNGVELQVPMFPTKKLWARVMLSDPTEWNAYEVRYVDQISGPVAVTGNPDDRFLGYFSPGEGMTVLRGMVFSWFRTFWPNLKGSKCPSSSHGYQQEMMWVRDLKDSRFRDAQFYCLFKENLCIGCARSLDDVDDLVPDDAWSSPRRTWNRR